MHAALIQRVGAPSDGATLELEVHHTTCASKARVFYIYSELFCNRSVLAPGRDHRCRSHPVKVVKMARTGWQKSDGSVQKATKAPTVAECAAPNEVPFPHDHPRDDP